jgi:hypothetical protein
MILSSRRLSVDVAPAGTVYRGARFDWTGFITQVVLDGRHRFCTQEALHGERSSGGIGLCNEFGLDLPVGFAEALPGEAFPKLGVGLLTRPDLAAVDHMRAYHIEPFAFSEEADERSARWSVAPRPCRGYAARLDKELVVDEDRLRVSYRLENCGERRLRTTEYNHNFISIDGHATGSDLRLSTSSPITAASAAHGVVFGSDGITWPDGVSGFAARCQVPAGGAPGFSWTLAHLPSAVQVSERLDRPALALALWGVSHVVCPELFIAIDLAAGESATWTREYRFAVSAGRPIRSNR